MIDDVRERCRQSMGTACLEMKHRFPMDSNFLEMCSIYAPKCLSANTLIQFPTFADLATTLPRLFAGDMQKLYDEWRFLRRAQIPKALVENKNLEEFYKGLLELADEDGNHLFALLPYFVLHILALPTSNVDAERIFSKVGVPHCFVILFTYFLVNFQHADVFHCYFLSAGWPEAHTS